MCGVRDQGFGFVRSHAREFNIFFRLSEVISEGGLPVREGDVVVGSCLSFDVMEETRGIPNSKLRAIRVQLLPPNSVSLPSLITGNNNTNGAPLSMEGLSLGHMENSLQSPVITRASPSSVDLDHSGGVGFTLVQVRSLISIIIIFRFIFLILNNLIAHYLFFLIYLFICFLFFSYFTHKNTYFFNFI